VDGNGRLFILLKLIKTCWRLLEASFNTLRTGWSMLKIFSVFFW